MNENEKNLLETCRANRDEYLAQYKSQFEKARDPEIIIELLHLEPALLKVDWIAAEIARWMLLKDCVKYLKRAFLRKHNKGLEDEKTLKSKRQDYMAWHAVEQLRAKKGLSAQEAFVELSRQVEDENAPEATELIIKHKYYRHKKLVESRKLPYPFYGVDYEERDGKFVIIMPIWSNFRSVDGMIILSPENVVWADWSPPVKF